MSAHDQVASIAEINPVEPDSHGGRPHHWGRSVHFAGARATSLFGGRRCLSVAVCGVSATAIRASYARNGGVSLVLAWPTGPVDNHVEKRPAGMRCAAVTRAVVLIAQKLGKYV